MQRGKSTCKILKEIRRQIASANGIGHVTKECHYKGACMGTCPACEAEVRDLEQKLRQRSLAGKAVRLAGISASVLALSAPLTAQEQSTPAPTVAVSQGTLRIDSAAHKIEGIVVDEWGEPILGVMVVNNSLGSDTRTGTCTDTLGHFSIEGKVGDQLTFSFVGYKSIELTVTPSTPNPVQFTEALVVTMGIVPAEHTRPDMVPQNSTSPSLMPDASDEE